MRPNGYMIETTAICQADSLGELARCDQDLVAPAPHFGDKRLHEKDLGRGSQIDPDFQKFAPLF